MLFPGPIEPLGFEVRAWIVSGEPLESPIHCLLLLFCSSKSKGNLFIVDEG
jgi:hypothetical protein